MILILASAPTGAAADIRNRGDGRNGTRTPECSETVHRALFVHVTEAGDSGRATVESVEMTQDEATVARTENRPSAVWAEAGALAMASGASAAPNMKEGTGWKWRRRIIPTAYAHSDEESSFEPARSAKAGRANKDPRVRPRDVEEWSGRRDSNPRPQPWQGCALPLSYARSERGPSDRPG